MADEHTHRDHLKAERARLLDVYSKAIELAGAIRDRIAEIDRVLGDDDCG